VSLSIGLSYWLARIRTAFCPLVCCLLQTYVSARVKAGLARTGSDHLLSSTQTGKLLPAAFRFDGDIDRSETFIMPPL
jgi:hypothetical protein